MKMPIPRIIKCVACDNDYEYYKRLNYMGKSNKRCPECQIRYKVPTLISGNDSHRPMGHNTRNQHKKAG